MMLPVVLVVAFGVAAGQDLDLNETVAPTPLFSASPTPSIVGTQPTIILPSEIPTPLPTTAGSTDIPTAPDSTVVPTSSDETLAPTPSSLTMEPTASSTSSEPTSSPTLPPSPQATTISPTSAPSSPSPTTSAPSLVPIPLPTVVPGSPTRSPTTPMPSFQPSFRPTFTPTRTLWPTTSDQLGGGDGDGGGGGGGKKSGGGDDTAIIVTVVVVLVVLLAAICGLWFMFCRQQPVDVDEDYDIESSDKKKNSSSSAMKNRQSSAEEQKDVERGMKQTKRDKPPNKIGFNSSTAVNTGKALVAGLLVAGTAIPGLEGVCNLAVFVLYEVEQLANKADDVVAAGDRVIKVLEVLKILSENARRLDNDSAKRYVGDRMVELEGLLDQFLQLVKSFRERGWLRRRWFLYEHGNRLSSLDQEIVRTLDNLRLAYHLAQDRKLTRLLESQRYEIECVIEKQISRLMNAGQTEHDAVVVLAEDEDAMRAVAVAAHTSESELNKELAVRLSTMQSGIDDIKAGVQGLQQIVTKTKAKDEAKAHKTHLLETYEIELDHVEPTPFARGGNAQVHKATYTGEPVALKRVPLHGYTAAKRTKLLANFTEELGIMVKLRNPLVVQVYGVVTSDPEYLGLCMEYCSKGSLRHRLDDRNKRIEWSQRRQWLSQIARGMHFLYSNQIQHRDLKSSNILLSDNDAAKVADFGLSRSEDLRTGTTREAAGTLAFMAPELLSENVFTEKSDVYSFAVTTYEVLTRAHPFEDMSQAQIVMKAALKEERPTISPKLLDRIPADLVAIMEKCWLHEPKERPTFADVVRMLFVVPPNGDGRQSSGDGDQQPAGSSYFEASVIEHPPSV